MSWLSVCAVVAIPIIIALIVSREYSEHKRLVVQSRIVRNPHYAVWVGCVGTIFFVGITVYALVVEGAPLWAMAGLVLFDILGLTCPPTLYQIQS